MNLLEKYNLDFCAEFPLTLRNIVQGNSTRTSDVLIDLVFSLSSGGAYFNAKTLLMNVLEVKYGMRQLYNYFPDAGRGSIHISSNKIYFTTQEDENQTKRIADAYDEIDVDLFVNFLQDLLTRLEDNLSKRDRILKVTLFKFRDVIENLWIEGFGLACANNHSIALILGVKKLIFTVSKDCTEFKIYESDLINYRKAPDVYKLKVDSGEEFLSNYITELRSNALPS